MFSYFPKCIRCVIYLLCFFLFRIINDDWFNKDHNLLNKLR